MALLKCHECGNAVSSEASACPKCGAKVKKSTSVVVQIAALLFGAGVLYSIFSPSGTPHTSQSPKSATSTIQQVESNNAAQPKPLWKYSVNKDDMSGKEIAYAQTSSANKQNLHWPYGPGIGARLNLRRHPRSGKNAFVEIDKGQILCRSYESCTIMIRFDDRPASKYAAKGPSDGSSDTVFILNYSKFFAELKKSKTLIIELPMYQDGNRSWNFNVDDLSWK